MQFPSPPLPVGALHFGGARIHNSFIQISKAFQRVFTRGLFPRGRVNRPVKTPCYSADSYAAVNSKSTVEEKTVKALRRFIRLVSFVLGSFLFLFFLCGSAFAGPSCNLDPAHGKIKHVIFVVFDNVHFTRDNRNVPSDLEQMPHLLNFLQQNGTFESNHHAVLISHTADDIVTALTGVYGDRHGVSVANSYGVFRPDGSVAFPSSFFYWTDLVNDENSSTKDFTYSALTANGQNAPAPWVPFTRSGCDFGAFSTANVVIERTPFDVVKIFGPCTAMNPQAPACEDFDHQTADFEGVAVHCAQGSALCSATNGGVTDLLPQEPRGYTGYNGLFGAKFVVNALGGPLKDLDGNVEVNADSGLVGFTGFDPSASQTLGAIASMQEAGIPVTFAYIADAHDDHVNGVAFGPGQAGYVAQLRSYDAAFAKFFARLASDGIDRSSTLFVFTADEGDHFAGGTPSPANCDGVNVPCTYPNIGELDVNLNGLVAQETGDTTSFSIHFDDAPTVYIKGDPASAASVTRQLEREFSGLTEVNPVTNNTDKLTVALADPTEMGLLHMITADPERTPSFTMFGDADYFFSSFGSPAPVEDSGFAWNHGGIQPEVARTWLGMVGPGVQVSSPNSSGNNNGQGTLIAFSDHTDVRPTMLALLGLQDDYSSDGRILIEALAPSVLPASVDDNLDLLVQLGQVYKQINAPFGQLGIDSLKVSTMALSSNSPNDATYTNLENTIAGWRTRRDTLAAEIKATMDAAASGQNIDQNRAQQLIGLGRALIDEVSAAASGAN